MKHLLPILLLFCVVSARAQSDSLPGNPSLYQRWANRNCIKIDPPQLVIGELPVSWEHRFGNRFSLELSAGPTLTHFMGSRYWMDKELELVHVFGGEEEQRVGIAYGLSGRYYLQKSAVPMTGLYLAAGVRHRVYRDIETCHTSELIPHVQVGYQLATHEPFLVDFYAGIAVSRLSLEGPYNYYYGGQYGFNVDMERQYWKVLPTVGVRMAAHQHPGVVKQEKPEVTRPEQRFAIKLDPVQSLVGEFPIVVEACATSWLSVELTAGITRTQFGKERYYLEVPYFPSAVSSYDKINFPGTGYVASLAARFYPFANGMQGFYISPRVQHRVYVSENRFESLEGKSTSKEYSGILTLGYQFRLGNSMLLDVYGGVNVTWMKAHFNYVGETAPAGPQGPFDHWTPVNTEQFEQLPAAGIRLGYGF